MIWDLIEQSEFDKHFSRPDLTITALLLDENIITELKNQHPKLLEYIAQHKQQFMAELIEYTVVMPLESDSYDRGHKLPYISSQLLAIDSELIYQEFFRTDIPEESNPFWLQLIHFLETDAAQNEILMGYFEKVLNNLYNGNKPKTTQVVATHLPKFSKLLHNGSIGDILKKTIILLNTPEGAVLEERERILREVVSRFVGTDESVKEICSDILTEVVSRFQSFSSGDILIQKLLSNEELHEVYWIQHSPAVNDFLVGLLKKTQQRVVNENDVSVRILTIPTTHLDNLSKYLKSQVQNISQLIPSNAYITNQNKALVRKSNKKIYPILTLASLAIEENLFGFITTKFINSLWNLIILYPYNNIMQVSVLKIFTSILKTSATQVRNIFLDRYEEYLLQLSKNNLQMFRPLIFTIWNQAKAHLPITSDQEVLEAFSTFKNEHLQPLLKYEINKSSIQHQQTHNKLVVDEEDKQPTYKQQTQSPTTEAEFVPHPQPAEDFQPANKAERTPPKDSFDFFTGWETEQKQEKPKEAEKPSLFDDFTNFF